MHKTTQSAQAPFGRHFSKGLKASDLVKSMTGLLALGKSDFETIENYRSDGFLNRTSGLRKVPSSAWLRWRLDAAAPGLREIADEPSLRQIESLKALMIPQTRVARLDFKPLRDG